MRAEPTSRAVWLRVVRRAALPDRTKLLLTTLSDEMNASGVAQVTNTRLVQLLGWTHDRSVSRHLAYAFEAGYLVRAGGGHRGFTSVYQATLPGGKVANRSPTGRHTGGQIGRQLVDALPRAIGDLSERGKVANCSPLLATSIRQSERSEHGAVGRSAAHDPATTATSGSEDQAQALRGGAREQDLVSPVVLAARADWAARYPA